MSEDDAEGCGCAVVMMAALIFTLWCVWEYNHPTPEQVAARQQVEERAKEDRDLAEWNRTKQLREMRADKSQPETQP